MRTVTTLLDIAGIALVVAGVSLWSAPAALIVAGVAAVALSWRMSGGES